MLSRPESVIRVSFNRCASWALPHRLRSPGLSEAAAAAAPQLGTSGVLAAFGPNSCQGDSPLRLSPDGPSVYDDGLKPPGTHPSAERMGLKVLRPQGGREWWDAAGASSQRPIARSSGGRYADRA